MHNLQVYVRYQNFGTVQADNVRRLSQKTARELIYRLEYYSFASTD